MVNPAPHTKILTLPPGFVQLLRSMSRFAMNRHFASTRPLAAKSKPFFAIKPVNQVLADRPALTFQQDVDTRIAISNAGLNNLVHASADLQTRIPNAWLPLGRSMLARQSAGP